MNQIHLQTIIEPCLFIMMINNFLENAEKYGIRSLN